MNLLLRKSLKLINPPLHIMPLYHKNISKEGDFLVAVWQITETAEELVSPLPDGESLLAEAVGRFKAVSRRAEWLAVRCLMHEVGCREVIKYHPSGRPYLESGSFQISISHTRGYAAIALHRILPVGIDIEQRAEKVCRVKDKFLSNEEKSFLPSEKKNVEALLVIWTAKEAIFKLVDREGIDFAEHFHVSPFGLAEEGCLQAYETFTDEQLHFECDYRIYPDFVLTLAQKLIL